MSAKYVIRLDDASEHMDYNKWNPYFELFNKYDIKPIIAIIPFNKDPKMVIENPDADFWNKARQWQEKGYRIALHGYEHLYKTGRSGMIGINKRSEFAGVPLEEQMEMLTKAYNKFENERIKADIFVAPAHSFDKNTLKAIKQVTSIKYISDGFFINPIHKDGFMWIPQQLWEPCNKTKGVWTICFHPEISNDSVIRSLELFIKEHTKDIIDPLSPEFKKIRFEDVVFSQYMKCRMKIRSCLNYFR